MAEPLHGEAATPPTGQPQRGRVANRKPHRGAPRCRRVGRVLKKSRLGNSRPSMSALASLCRLRAGISRGPRSATSGTSPWLFDHFVGAGEQRGRHGEAKRLGSLHVDHEFELRGLLDGEVRNFRPFQYPINVSRGVPM
jgi:hypothetical protein